MLFVYLNYPNSGVSFHSDPNCGHIRSHRKTGQRTVKLGISSLSAALGRFVAEGHRFGASADINDMWLAIDCSDHDFETAVAQYVHRLLATKYKRFRDADIHICKCSA